MSPAPNIDGTMPNVIGMTTNGAESTINQASHGGHPTYDVEESGRGGTPGTVWNQTPAADEQITRNGASTVADLGRVPGDSQADDDEDPWRASLTPFLIGKHEVTQFQWHPVMGDNPTSLSMRDGRLPIDTVTWDRAVEFGERCGVELPTEAQWELACRAGSTSVYPWGDDPDLAETCANLFDRSTGRPDVVPWNDGFRETAPVGSFEPNDFGLHDMQGNVHEWCRDKYVRHRVSIASPGDALAMRGPVEGSRTSENRVFRGASWYNTLEMARSSHREHTRPSTLMSVLGFRVVRSVQRT